MTATTQIPQRPLWQRMILPLSPDNPARALLVGYLLYMIAGTVLLMLPFAQKVPIAVIDVVFIAASAVSTTGLVTVDPGTSFTGFGQAVILGLIQLGGLGYMTIGSFALLVLQHRLSSAREETARACFDLPRQMEMRSFLVAVVSFTAVVELAGAAALYPMFRDAGVEAPLWSAVFHAVSAFCTAGFSLNATSLEAFSDHTGITLTISALSILGAMGFLIVADAYRALRRHSLHLGFTTKVIVWITGGFLLCGTAFLFLAEPSITALPLKERALTAFFQAMTAATTVGFNTVPIGGIASAALVVLMLLMMFGASPAGTGGGLKTTSFAVLFALVRAVLKGRDRIRFAGREIPRDKVRSATAGLVYYGALLFVAMIVLLMTEAGAPFEQVLFEAMSAMGTVGLSMGLTGDLSTAGKLLIVVLMTAGRLGILTFGLAIAIRDDRPAEERSKLAPF